MIRAYHALITHGGVPSGALMSYGCVADPLDLAGVALFSFEIVVADVIMVSLIVAVGYLVMMRTFFVALSLMDRVGTQSCHLHFPRDVVCGVHWYACPKLERTINEFGHSDGHIHHGPLLESNAR